MQLQHQLLIFLDGGILKEDLGDLSGTQLQERDIVDAAASAQVSTLNKKEKKFSSTFFHRMNYPVSSTRACRTS
jgi:hypothetical protein